MKQQKSVEIDDFLIAIDSLISSKYILAERKISDVLLYVAKTSDVYNLIAKCMVNFDFETQWKTATSSHFFKLPEFDEDRVAFIFCLLSNIDDKNINFTYFLSEFFSAANSYSAYELFSKTVLVEFKRLIIKFIIKNDDKNEKDIIATKQNKKNNFEKLALEIADLLTKVKLMDKIKHSFLEKNDLIALLSTFALVCENKQTEYLYAFRVTLNASLLKNKLTKVNIEQINQIVDKLIRGIYE